MGRGQLPPRGKDFPSKAISAPKEAKCETVSLMIAVRIAVDLLDNEIIPVHSFLHSHFVSNYSYKGLNLFLR